MGVAGDVQDAAGAAPPLSAPQYFRSDLGVATDPGMLPERLDGPAVERWRVSVDPGLSTPLIVDRQILLTSFLAAEGELAIESRRLEDGETLWRRGVHPERIEATHFLGSPATATVAVAAGRVFAFFGSYGLVACDLSGNVLWERRLGPFQDEFGAGSSPVIAGDRVILLQDHDRDSFLAAYDVVSGTETWRVARPDAVRSYATPAVWQHDGEPEILVAGALELGGYDLRTGALKWRAGGLARIVIPTPVPSGDRIYMASWSPGGDASGRISLGPWETAIGRWDRDGDGQLARNEVDNADVLDRFFRMDLDQNGRLDREEWVRHSEVFQRAHNSLLAVRPPRRGSEKGEAEVLWKYTRGVPYVTTPVVHQGMVWMVKDGGIVTHLDAETGDLLNEERLPGQGRYFASPVLGDGNLYFASEQGVLSILAGQRKWLVRSSLALGEKVYASPVLHRGSVLVRTDAALHRFRLGRR